MNGPAGAGREWRGCFAYKDIRCLVQQAQPSSFKMEMYNWCKSSFFKVPSLSVMSNPERLQGYKCWWIPSMTTLFVEVPERNQTELEHCLTDIGASNMYSVHCMYISCTFSLWSPDLHHQTFHKIDPFAAAVFSPSYVDSSQSLFCHKGVMAKVFRPLYGCVGLLITRVFYLGGSGTTFVWTAHRYIAKKKCLGLGKLLCLWLQFVLIMRVQETFFSCNLCSSWGFKKHFCIWFATAIVN